MLEIVTLFLGLVTGPQTVVLDVGAPATAVEVLLDGQSVAWLDAPPWRLEVDLGEALAPHEILAIARDAAGRELARARQWVNLDMPQVKVGGRSPPGGLTPLAVVTASSATPAPGEMGAWFLVHGEPLAVHAVHSGSAEVVVVQQPAARPALAEMARLFLTYQLERLGLPAVPPREDSPRWPPDLLRLPQQEFQRAALAALDIPGSAPESRRIGPLWAAYHGAGDLGEETRLRFISSVAAPVSRSDRERFLFVSSAGVADVGLLWLAGQVRPLGFAQRLADAVAIAGREAHASGRRRAVVLLLSGETADDSLHGPAAVRDYLRALQVPLFVWTLSAAPPPAAWGEARFIGLQSSGRGGRVRRDALAEAFDRLDAAAAELRRELASQQIVLLAGEHLPHRVELAAAAAAAGATPAGLETPGGRHVGELP